MRTRLQMRRRKLTRKRRFFLFSVLERKGMFLV